ncbi:MAG: rhomboid family intramembrane serine protease [Candidatus Spyradocola sp.]|jgi:rhomboid protease GluP
MQQPERISINRSRPYVTYALIGINVAVFLVELFLQYVLRWPYGQTILTLGAKENLLIASGQYWRLLTACFLHANFMHILSNLIGLYFWGPHAELLLGRMRYLVVYLAAGLFGSLLSFAVSDPLSVSVGASGAIFGIFGALLYFRTRHKQVFNQVFGMQVLAFIGLNLLNGFLSTGIDNLGHIGGLIGGFCAAYAVGLYRERLSWKRILAAVGLVLLAVGLFAIGYLRSLHFLLTGPV